MRTAPKVLGLLLLAIGILPISAENAPGNQKVSFYSAEQVKKAFGVDPASPNGTNGVLGELLDSKKNPMFKGASSYKVTVRRKERKQDPEFHKTKIHIFYVLEGNATLVTGGSMSGKAKGVDEGDTVKFPGQTVVGGETFALDKGSIVVIPAGAMHWFKDIPGKPWLAFNVELF